MPRYTYLLCKVEAEPFEIETPMGPKSVTVDSRGSFSLRYRSEDLVSYDLERLRQEIQRAEAEYQNKKARGDLRKQMEKDSVEAVLYVPVHTRNGNVIGSSVWTKRYEQIAVPMHLEQVTVRGIDQRSNQALITREDGSRESASWQRLLKPLTESDAADIMAAQKAGDRAREQVEKTKPLNVSRAIVLTHGNEYLVDVTVGYDAESGLFCAEHKGHALTGKDQKEIESLVHAIEAYDLGYRFVDEGREVHAIEPGVSQISSYADLYHTRAEYEAKLAAEQEAKRTAQVLKDTLLEYAFDRSMITEDV